MLYEMLTGRRAFEGDDVTDTLAAVVRGQPDWNALPAAMPANLRALLKRCLEKDPKHRLHDIADFRILFDRAAITSAAPAPARRFRLGIAIAAAVVIMAAAVSGLAVSMLRPEPALPVRRFAISLAEGVQFPGLGRQIVALSPDGARLVYVADDRLYLRSMDRLEGEAVRGTEAARGPFFSPDVPGGVATAARPPCPGTASMWPRTGRTSL